jgi:hypothetical protein
MTTVTETSADIVDTSVATATIATPERRARDATDSLTSQLVLWSFVAAVVLAIAGFIVVAVYLFRYFNHALGAFSAPTMTQLANMAPNAMQSMLLARTGLWKFILQSCGIVSGVALGFLGFALFLLGAKGDMDAAFDDSQHKVQLSRMAPGSFVLLIAAILIGLCSTKSVTLDLPTVETRVVPIQSNQPTSGGAPESKSTNAPGPDLSHVRLTDPSVSSSSRSDDKTH